MNEQKHEQQCKADGAQNFRKEIRKAKDLEYYSSTKPGRHRVHERVHEFALRLHQKINLYRNGKGTTTHLVGANRLHHCAQVFGGFEEINEHGEIDPGKGTYIISMMTMKSILDFFTGNLNSQSKKANSNKTVTDACTHIADFVAAEWVFLQYMQSKSIPENVKEAGRRKMYDPDSTPSWRMRSPMTSMRKKLRKQDHPGLKEQKFDSTEKAKVGLFLLEIAADMNIIEAENVYDNKKNLKVIFLKDFHDALVALECDYEGRAYMHEPMIDKPQDWIFQDEASRKNTSGGYHWDYAKKKRTMCRSYYSESVFGDDAVRTLNNLQDTVYKIDGNTIKIANALMKQKQPIEVGKFQNQPQPPTDLERQEGATDEEIAERKWRQKLLHDAHRKKVKKFLRTKAVLNAANKFNNGKGFYLGWSLDYRGRMYPLNSFLQIQGTDFEKSLLRFSEGCELTDSGTIWAERAIGAAYLGTEDSYKVRENWTRDNQELITRIASNPFDTIPEWEVADEPWSFLQLCFEWYAVKIAKTRKLWYVPVGIDSTASGLQLLSAMRLDKQGMKYSNLLKPEKDTDGPLDAYKAVLKLARCKATEQGDGRLTVYLQDRKVGKPALMLSIYGGSYTTIKEKIANYFRKKKIEIENDDLKKVTSLVIASSKELFPAAFAALKWLKELAVIAVQKDKRIQWTTPTDDKIDLTENIHETMQVRSEIMGRINISLGQGKRPDDNAMKKAFRSIIRTFVRCKFVQSSFQYMETTNCIDT